MANYSEFWWQDLFLEAPSSRKLLIAPRRFGKTETLLQHLLRQAPPLLDEELPTVSLFLSAKSSMAVDIRHAYARLLDPSSVGPVPRNYIYSVRGDKIIFRSELDRDIVGRVFDTIYLDEVDWCNRDRVMSLLVSSPNANVLAATTPRAKIGPPDGPTTLEVLLGTGEFLTIQVPLQAFPDGKNLIKDLETIMSPESFQREIRAVYV